MTKLLLLALGLTVSSIAMDKGQMEQSQITEQQKFGKFITITDEGFFTDPSNAYQYLQDVISKDFQPWADLFFDSLLKASTLHQDPEWIYKFYQL